MPRNKSTKRATKRQSTMLNSANLQKIETDLYAYPIKLAKQLNKAIRTHQKQEAKLTKTINKFKNTIKNADARAKDAAEKNSPAGKVQFKKFKKIYSIAVKKHADVEKQHQKVSDLLEVLQHKQTKLIALNKNLNQFEKEWSKNNKKTKSQAKQAAARKKSSKIIPLDQQSKVERIDVSTDTNLAIEPAELVS